MIDRFHCQNVATIPVRLVSRMLPSPPRSPPTFFCLYNVQRRFHHGGQRCDGNAVHPRVHPPFGAPSSLVFAVAAAPRASERASEPASQATDQAAEQQAALVAMTQAGRQASRQADRQSVSQATPLEPAHRRREQTLPLQRAAVSPS